MSAKAVRDAFRAELTAQAAIIGAPFYDTINQAQKIADPAWFTMEPHGDFIDRQCIGGYKNLESGTVDIVVMALAGTGDDAGITLAGKLLENFILWSAGTVQTESIIPISEIASGDAEGLYYGLIFSVEYSYRF